MSLAWHNRRMAELRKRDEENREQRKKVAYMLRKKAEEEEKELQWQLANVCPRCFITLNLAGECMMGCGYKKK